MQVVILAGGAGTRLSHLTGNHPKALVDVDGKPLLHRQIEIVVRHQFSKVLLLVRQGANDIRVSCGDGSAWGIAIEYAEEAKPHGTAGALLQAREHLDDRFAVLYGDTVLNVDLSRMWSTHVMRGADATLFVHPNDHPYDSDIVETDTDDRIIALHPYPHPPGCDLPNLVNAALYIIEKRCLEPFSDTDGIFDFAKDLFPILLRKGKYLSAYRSREYIKDAGTPDRLSVVVTDVKSGRVERGSMETLAPAVFLDRDGTLIDDPGYIAAPEQVRLFPGVGEAIRRLNRSNYLAVLTTNQPVVARGDVDEKELKRIHNRLEQLLGSDRAYLDAIYYCPHHPARGFSGERAEYKIACTCRKPGIGMIERAIRDMNIDLAASWMIGDSSTDVETSARANLRSVLLSTGQGGRDSKYPRRPDFEFLTLRAAVDFIVDSWPEVKQTADTIAGQINSGDVVLIGGLARSGKSIFASALVLAMRHLQADAANVISLDGWIKPLEERDNASTVIDRYDIVAIEQAMTRILAQSGNLVIPIYDRKRRGPGPCYSLDSRPNDIFIFEGVVALLLRCQTARRIVRIYVSRDEHLRYQTMAADYHSRGFTDNQFARLYAQRQLDEMPFVVASCKAADFIVELK